jgi:hypothetical protein
MPLPIPATAAGPTFFVLGVWDQPAAMMSTWKARGVNTMVEVPEGHDVADWAGEANAEGLFQIRHPRPKIADDLADRRLLAWATRDEPSNTSDGVIAPGHVSQTPAQIVQEAAPWRAAAKATGRFVPVWTNHVASHIYPDWGPSVPLMRDYMRGLGSDWLSSDAYPVQAGSAFVMRASEGYTSTTQGVALDRQIAWSGGKPVMAFIGVSAFAPGQRAPTSAEFAAMAWSSVIHGASGVIYFPQQLAPTFDWDVTPRELVKAISAFDRQVRSIDSVLMDDKNGGRRPFKVYRSANSGVQPAATQLPAGFEATEIKTASGLFRIVLNLSAQDKVLDRPEWGLTNATFHGYEVRMGYGLALAAPASGRAGK